MRDACSNARTHLWTDDESNVGSDEWSYVDAHGWADWRSDIEPNDRSDDGSYVGSDGISYIGSYIDSDFGSHCRAHAEAYFWTDI